MAASGPPSTLSRPSERAGSGFECFQTKPPPSLEESPLPSLKVELSNRFFRDRQLQGSGQKSTYRTCRLLPARYLRISRVSGRSRVLRTSDTSRPICP